MGCEQSTYMGLCPRGVCLQTVAGMDIHKWAKVKRKAGEAVLNQPSEIAALHKTPQGELASRKMHLHTVSYTRVRAQINTHPGKRSYTGFRWYPHLQNTLTEPIYPVTRAASANPIKWNGAPAFYATWLASASTWGDLMSPVGQLKMQRSAQQGKGGRRGGGGTWQPGKTNTTLHTPCRMCSQLLVWIWGSFSNWHIICAWILALNSLISCSLISLTE